jgi:hypothetical protein
VCLVTGGVEGLHFPKITRYQSTSRAFPGARNRGWQTESRDVFWPVLIWSDGSGSWLDLYTQFFDTMHPDRPGTWSVTTGSTTRTLQVTGTFDGGVTYDQDPMETGWMQYPVSLEAVQPYWSGDVLTQSWQGTSPTDFFNTTGATPFNISSAADFSTATMDNPGDVDAYPVWVIAGPLSSVSVGVGSKLVNVPFSVASGDILVIDTDPRNVTARMGAAAVVLDADGVPTGAGTDQTAALGFQSFAPIPDGTQKPLAVSATGSGSVTCRLVPLYFRAF